MAELVDALDLKSNVRKSVPVRVRPVAPLNIDMDRFIGKLIDAFIDLLGDLWDNKRKPENKKKTIKQWWKDYRADVKKQQEEYKKLPFKEKVKLGWKDFKKKMKILLLSTLLFCLIIWFISTFDLVDDFNYLLSLEWLDI